MGDRWNGYIHFILFTEVAVVEIQAFILLECACTRESSLTPAATTKITRIQSLGKTAQTLINWFGWESPSNINIIDAKLIILIGTISAVIDAPSEIMLFFFVVSIGRIHRTNAIQMTKEQKRFATLATNSIPLCFSNANRKKNTTSDWPQLYECNSRFILKTTARKKRSSLISLSISVFERVLHGHRFVCSEAPNAITF